MAVLKAFLQQLAAPSCRWGHRWGCWSIQGENNLKQGKNLEGPVKLQTIAMFKFALLQQRQCLVCSYVQVDVKTIDMYDGTTK